MPVDPRELRELAGIRPKDGPSHCPNCNYDFAGLPAGAPCPECGHTARRATIPGIERDNLTDAPISYLRVLTLGFVMMSLGMMACVVAFSWFRVGSRPEPAALGVIGAVVWWLGVFIVTGPRRSALVPLERTIAERRWRRRVNRALQGSWAAFWGVRFVLASAPQTGIVDTLLHIGEFGFFLVGIFGIPLLCGQLVDIAEWAADDTMMDRLRLAGGGILVCGLFIFVGPFAAQALPPLVPFMFAMIMFMSAAFLLSVAFFMVCCFQLANMSRWAIKNWSALRDRDARMAARAQQGEAMMQRRVRRTMQAIAEGRRPEDEPVSSLPPSSIPRPGGATMYMDPASKANPYDVAPE